MSKIVDLVRARVCPTIEQMGYEIVDIEYRKILDGMHLTFFIHSGAEGGTTLDDCEKVHTAIDPMLDEIDPTNGEPYILNVSSPGLDRPFKTRRDFERNTGKEIELRLYAAFEKKKVYEGVLTDVAYTDEKHYSLTITTLHGQYSFSAEQIATVRPLVKF